MIKLRASYTMFMFDFTDTIHLEISTGKEATRRTRTIKMDRERAAYVFDKLSDTLGNPSTTMTDDTIGFYFYGWEEK